MLNPEEVSRAGVFISLGSQGLLRIDRGYVRAADEPVLDTETGQPTADTNADPSRATRPLAPTVTVSGGAPVEPVEDDDDVMRPLPERLVTELTAERTLALRDALAQAPDAAFIALLHAMCRSVFHAYSTSGCVEISIRQVYFGNAAPDLRDNVWAQSIQQRHQAWADVLPDDPDQLWDALTAMAHAEQLQLLAHCTSLSVNALYEPAGRYGQGQASAHGVGQRLASADHIARTIGLDMAQAGWQPTVANYLGRVTKPRILAAVREARGEAMVGLIDHLKKGDMAKEAARLLEGSGWLPEPLRLLDLDDQSSTASPDDDENALPAFLSNDDEAADGPIDDDSDPESYAIAAE